MDQFTMRMPTAVYGGKGALQNLKAAAAGAAKAAVFTDRGILDTGLLEMPLAVLREAGVESTVISDLPPEPTYGQVQQLVEQFHASGADFIVAVGGGSVMDTAKLAGLLAGTGRTVKDLLDNPGPAVKTVRTCLIPTTAGTGSEATPNAIVAVPERELKVGIVNAAMVPDYVILDAAMVQHLPRGIAAATGIDAMAHAIECFTSKKANPFSDTFALEALDLIINNIETACDDPLALEAKNRMQIAAFYAGVAITCSGTTAVHALSYPLGGKYHIPHGVSNAMLLLPVMRFNEPAIRSRLAAAYDRVAHGGTARATEEEKSAWLIRRMGEITAHLDIPVSLAEFHVSPDDLDGLVDAGMQVTRLLVNNMREVTPADARAIYRQVLGEGERGDGA